MLLRRTAPLALALAALAACEPSQSRGPTPAGTPDGNPAAVDYAAFDPTASPPAIPLPSDLALAAAATQTGAQGELLQLFAKQKGFPNDQEVPVTIDFVRQTIDQSSGALTRSAPPLDVATLTASNVVVLQVTGTGTPGPVALETVTAADYVTNGDHGTLTLHKKFDAVTKSRRWSTSATGARYVIAVRGGPSGVKTTDGQALSPQPAMYLLEQDKDLSKPENQGLLPGTKDQKAAAGAQLEQLRLSYLPAFAALDAAGFDHHTLAVMGTFSIAPLTAAHLETDVGAGIIPLPNDLLLDPATNFQTVRNVPSAFGPLAPGIATLDGFSTTAMSLLPASAPIIVGAPGPGGSFLNALAASVFLYEISADGSTATLVNPASYELEPPSVRQLAAGAYVSTVIGIQPASISKPGTKPLKEKTTYAVVVTNGVKGIDQKPITRTTLASLLLFSNPLVVGGKAQVPGLSDADASGVERIRLALAPVLTSLPAGIAKDKIALAYTFRTQTITGPSLQLAAAPYSPTTPAPFPAGLFDSKTFVTSGATVMTAAQAFTKYGIETDPQAAVPNADIGSIIEATYPTVNVLSDATGGLDPAHAQLETLNVLIATPSPAIVATLPACPGGSGLRCAPLVIFHHGLGGGRPQMLLIANELVKSGVIVAAIDAPKHNDRAWCAADPAGANNNYCAAGGTCVKIPTSENQGDAIPPGRCTNGLIKQPVLCHPGACAASATDGVAVVSAQYYVGQNFFRTRDSNRQDVFDHAALILALSRPPPPTVPAVTPGPTSVPVTMAVGQGLAIDGRVFWTGQSLGAILGAVNTASNPRISRAVLNVGGGTSTDVLVLAPDFQAQLDALLTSLHIVRGSPDFLKLLQVAKWVLDAGDAINYTDHISQNTLPNLLVPPGTPPPPQPAKPVLGQIATCDRVVPNPTNQLFYDMATAGAGSGRTIFSNSLRPAAPPFCPSGGALYHGFWLSWGFTPGAPATFDANDRLLTQFAQDDAASFLTAGTIPPPTRTSP